MRKVICLICGIFSLVLIDLVDCERKSNSKNYEEAFKILKSFDFWNGPAIPRFFEPSRYQKNHLDDPPKDVETFKINQSLDNFDLRNANTFQWVSLTFLFTKKAET